MPLACLPWLQLGRLAAASVAAVILTFPASASVAVAQDATPRDWRRTDMSEDTFGATAVGAEVDGVRRVTVVILAPVDRHPTGASPFRSVVFESEARCGERMWRITSATYYASDLSMVNRHGPVPEAPLVRETPLHAAIADACDGGFSNIVSLKTPNPPEVVRWLAEASPADAGRTETRPQE